MKVLGVDPGLTRCGVAVIEFDNYRKINPKFVSVLKSDKNDDLPTRLLNISKKLEQVLDEYTPDAIAIERVFSQANVSTVIGTAQVSGIAAVEALKRDIIVNFYTPTNVKLMVTGNGKADKKQIIFMVKKILKLKENIKIPDAADACALAICHAWQNPFNLTLQNKLNQLAGKSIK